MTNEQIRIIRLLNEIELLKSKSSLFPYMFNRCIARRQREIEKLKTQIKGSD